MATILIVDDLSVNRMVLVMLLRSQGHRVLEAGGWPRGTGRRAGGASDLVITDVLMPVMDGYQLVKELRLDPATRRIPVVFYTAHYGEREARALARSSGVAYVLTKPAAAEEVLKIVDHVLGGQPATTIPATLLRSRPLSIGSTFGCSPTSSRKRPGI